jgi:hypothetical protein
LEAELPIAQRYIQPAQTRHFSHADNMHELFDPANRLY